MAKKPTQGLDSIFDSTDAPKKTTRKAAPAAPKAAAEAKAGGGNGNGNGDDFGLDRFRVLRSLLASHEAEALYRKGKEDRLLLFGIGAVAAITVGAFLVRSICATACGGNWFYSLVFRSFFALMVGMTGFTIAAMMELNRTRLQDVLAMIVKIHERFRLFEDGRYDDSGAAFLPNSYKFIGSTNDDETNYALLVVKVGAVISAVALFVLV